MKQKETKRNEVLSTKWFENRVQIKTERTKKTTLKKSTVKLKTTKVKTKEEPQSKKLRNKVKSHFKRLITNQTLTINMIYRIIIITIKKLRRVRNIKKIIKVVIRNRNTNLKLQTL
jgi:hypothetical protein